MHYPNRRDSQYVSYNPHVFCWIFITSRFGGNPMELSQSINIHKHHLVGGAMITILKNDGLRQWLSDHIPYGKSMKIIQPCLKPPTSHHSHHWSTILRATLMNRLAMASRNCLDLLAFCRYGWARSCSSSRRSCRSFGFLNIFLGGNHGKPHKNLH